MNPIKDLLEKPMTRQEFLKTAGLAVLALFGVSNFINYLLRNDSRASHQTTNMSKIPTTHGFGSRTFGN